MLGTESARAPCAKTDKGSTLQGAKQSEAEKNLHLTDEMIVE